MAEKEKKFGVVVDNIVKNVDDLDVTEPENEKDAQETEAQIRSKRKRNPVYRLPKNWHLKNARPDGRVYAHDDPKRNRAYADLKTGAAPLSNEQLSAEVRKMRFDLDRLKMKNPSQFE